MKAAGKTDPGNKRNNNQDALLINERQMLFVVADGMGGHAAGELASKLAVDKINEYFIRTAESRRAKKEQSLDPYGDNIKDITNAIKIANREIFNHAEKNPDQLGMGTTVVVALIEDDTIFIGHVGDSRLYRITKDSIQRVTKDHSRVQELIDSEAITEEEAGRSPFKNIITRALGGSPDVEVEISTIPYRNTDHYLLCTDGLHGVMSDEEIFEYVIDNPGDPANLVDKLIAEVKERGAPDNVTIISLEGSNFEKEVDAYQGDRKLKGFKLYEDEGEAIPSAKKKGRKEKDAIDSRIAEELKSRKEADKIRVSAELDDVFVGNKAVYFWGALLVILVLGFFILCMKNSRTYMVRYNPAKKNLILLKGKYLPWGFNINDNLSMGGDNYHWFDKLDLQMKKALRSGATFGNEQQAKTFVGNIAIAVAKEYLKSTRLENQNRALFYLNIAENYIPKEKLDTFDLDGMRAKALLRLGYLAESEEKSEISLKKALDYYTRALKHDPAVYIDEVLDVKGRIEQIKSELAEMAIVNFTNLLKQGELNQAEKELDKAESYGYDKELIMKYKQVIWKERNK